MFLIGSKKKDDILEIIASINYHGRVSFYPNLNGEIQFVMKSHDYFVAPVIRNF